VGVGDVNGDGLPDLLVIGHFDNGFFLRRGTPGGLAAPEPYPLPGHGRLLLVTDLNADGRDDVAVIHDGSGQPVHLKVFLGATTGPLTAGPSYATTFFTSQDIVAGDFDGDGFRDLVVGTGDGVAAILLFRGLRNGTLAAPVGLPPLATTPGASDGTAELDVADLNRDGRDDLVVAHGDPRQLLSVRLGRAEGLGPPREIPTESATDVAAGDVDGDGNPDVVMAHLDAAKVSLRLGRGDGTFADPTMLTLGSQPLSLALRDFDGDGRLDLAVADFANHNIVVVKNRGSP
jgi:hypothetical protein